jgi:ribosome biogenesis GTPase
MRLKELGFDDWFLAKVREPHPQEFSPARVTAVNKDNFLIRNETAEVSAEISGKLMYAAESSLDFPTVGDWVFVQYFNDNNLAIIHEILHRKSLLKRKMAGKNIDYQLIAANIDTAFIMQSLDANFNLRRLERYLIMVNHSNIEPVILLSKRDLISNTELQKKTAAAQNMNPAHDKDYNYEIIAFSNKTGEGIDAIQSLISAGKTYCLLGSSGVGKTTLLNRLIGQDVFTTGAVREKDSRGRHITARRQLSILENGGMIIDTPGMRELGNIGVDTGIKETFSDIVTLARKCRFNDCTHTTESGCAVVQAVEEGHLTSGRYQNYIKVSKESEYHEMSYLEKRRKDKKFGKMVKEMKKVIYKGKQ